MSIESAKAFVERMKTDKEFAKKILACKDWETALPLITKEGFDFTHDEIKLSENAELSDEEIGQVSGGFLCGGPPTCVTPCGCGKP